MGDAAGLAAVGTLAPLIAAEGERTDPALMTTWNSAVIAAERQARDAMIEALWRGYQTDARGRAPAILRVTITEADRHALAGYLIQGHAAGAVAEHLRRTLEYALDGIYAEDAAIPAAIAAAAQAHGARVASAVREAYFAGVQAATEAIGRALTGG